MHILLIFLVLFSVENRSQNLKSIIGRDFDSIVDFKSIFDHFHKVHCPLASGAMLEELYGKIYYKYLTTVE